MKNNLCLGFNYRLGPGERGAVSGPGKAMGHQMSRRGGAGKGHPGWEDQSFGTVSCRRAEEPRGQGLAAGSAQTRGQGYRWTPQLGRVRRDTGLSGGRLVRGGRALAPRVQRPREEARVRAVVITGEKGGH